MFAVDRGTIHALDTLNQILGRGWQSREASKDRGLKIASMKIASDERELDRLNQYAITLEAEQAENEKEFQRLSKLQRNLTKLEEESNVGNTDAKGIVEQTRSNIATSSKGIDDRLSSVQARREKLASDRKVWADTLYKVAPEAYEKYRGKDYKVDASEWEQMTTDLGIKGTDTRASQVMTAALRQSMAALEAGQYAREEDARKADLEERAADLDYAKYKSLDDYRKGLLSLQEREFGFKVAGEEGPKAPDIKSDINAYKQWRDATIGYGKTRERDIKDIATMPDVLTSATQVNQARDAIATEVGKVYVEGSDWDWNVPDELQGYEDEYKDANTLEDKAAAGAKIARFLRDYGDTKDVMDDDDAEYLDMVLRGYDILNRTQSKLDLSAYDPRESRRSIDELAGVGGPSGADYGGEMGEPQKVKTNEELIQEMQSIIEETSVPTGMMGRLSGSQYGYGYSSPGGDNTEKVMEALDSLKRTLLSRPGGKTIYQKSKYYQGK
jgi:hypothetical protein